MTMTMTATAAAIETICAWCPASPERTAALRAAGKVVSHGMCADCCRLMDEAIEARRTQDDADKGVNFIDYLDPRVLAAELEEADEPEVDYTHDPELYEHILNLFGR